MLIFNQLKYLNGFLKDSIENLSEGKLDHISFSGSKYTLPIHFIFRKFVIGFANLIRMLLNTSAKTNQSMINVSLYSDELKKQAFQINLTVMELSQEIKKSSDQIQVTSKILDSSKEEVNYIILGNKDILKASEDIQKSVTNGSVSIDNVVNIFTEISENYQSLKNSIEEISTSLKSIMGVTKEIATISEKTNLLALNAAIEAAHGGELGKGFAVVSDEIRKLAQQSHALTRKIFKGMDDLSKNTGRAVDKVNDSVKLGEQGQSIVGDSKSQYNLIFESIDTVLNKTKIFSQLGHNLEKSMGSIQSSFKNSEDIILQVSNSAEKVESTVNSQLENIEKVDSLIQESFKQSRLMNSIVSQFKTGDVGNLSGIQQMIQSLLERSLDLRGVMVTMINTANPKLTVILSEERQELETKMDDYLHDLKKHLTKVVDHNFHTDFVNAWSEFGKIREENTRLCLAGDYQLAKENLVNLGRARFKKSIDILNDWLDSFENQNK
jgi:methyl-accepting chemotaxis protein